MEGFIVVGCLIAIIIDIVFAVEFSQIAEEKGYSVSGYFWCCLLLGILGYLLVCALPDKTMKKKISKIEDEISKLKSSAAKSEVDAVTQTLNDLPEI